MGMGGPAFSILQSLTALLIIEKYRASNAHPSAFFLEIQVGLTVLLTLTAIIAWCIGTYKLFPL